MTTHPKAIELNESELPVYIVFRGKGNREAIYEVKPGGRKFGIALNAPCECVKKILSRR